MRIIVTRPFETMGALMKSLQDKGHIVLCAPMLEISPTYASVSYEGVAALVFTSANGVRFTPDLDEALKRDLAIYAVGPRTAITAKEMGFGSVFQAAGDVQDLESLIRQSQPKAEGRVIHLSGRVTKGDLVGQLLAAGYDAEAIEVYDAHAFEQLPTEVMKALSNGQIDAILFYSARTLGIFALNAEKSGLYPAFKAVRCLCLSQDIADKAQLLDWRSVHVAAQPNDPAMMDLVDMVAKL